VTIAEAWPAAGRPFTVAELDQMPDDGRRYELLDGALVVSPRPTLIDLSRKKVVYERFGVPSYWILNPEPPQPELTVFELRDGGYDLVAKASGLFVTGRPFSVSIDLADLTRGLRR